MTKPILTLALLNFALSSAVAADLPFTISPQTTSITSPLADDGSVDYVAAVNQHFGQGITPDNNGYIDYLRAIGPKTYPRVMIKQTIALLGVKDMQENDTGWTPYTAADPIDLFNFRIWKPEHSLNYSNYLQAQQKWLDMAVAATQKPQWWAPAVSMNGRFNGILLPHLNSMRTLSKTLLCRALLRVGQGDFDGFLSDIVAAKRLALRADDYTLIGNLVGANIEYLCDRTIASPAAAGIFTSDRCAKLAAALDSLPQHSPVWKAIDVGERWSMLDFTECVALGKTTGLITNDTDKRWFSQFNKIDHNLVDWDLVFRKLNENRDQLVKILQAPTLRDEQIDRQLFDMKTSAMHAEIISHSSLSPDPGEAKDAYSQRIAYVIITLVSPTVWRAENTCRCGPFEAQLARTVVAAAKFHADTGNWPDTLQQLVPAYVPAVPTELLSPTAFPVRYEKTGAGITIQAQGPYNGSMIFGGSAPQTSPAEGL